MTAPLPARRPDALDLFDAIAGAASDLKAVAWLIFDQGDRFDPAWPEHRDMLSRARFATGVAIAALDAYEARK